jgi:hypothetical protein
MEKGIIAGGWGQPTLQQKQNEWKNIFVGEKCSIGRRNNTEKIQQTKDIND